jgi:hypothetical protein
MRDVAVTVLAVIGFINVACMVIFAGLIWQSGRGRNGDGEQAAKQLSGWR